ncbi:MFS transporter [Pseudonocardia spinosispora]|uniref:MFS transporter n=1 Tax=Pseudonocardia spinosispora TaxID=103441 RepID=UPI0004139113|nr:MFS transporter [Pseudonocardia spinosispora]
MIDTHLRRTALLVAGCFFMENIDTTIVATSAPALAASLHVTPVATSMVLTAYLLALAMFIPLGGWLTSRFGARRIFMAAITVFTVASLGCAVSTNLTQLVATRVLQGVGGAMMVPVGRIVVMSGAAKKDIPKIMSFVLWPGLIAPVIAPLVGGLITTYASWRWMFGINIPLGVLAFVAAWRLNLADTVAAERAPLDWIGLLLTGLGLGGLSYAGHLIADDGASAPVTTGVGVGSLVLLVAAVAHLRRTAYPLIDLSPLRVPTFRVAALGGSLIFMVVMAVPFLLPLLFQEVFGWSPVFSGAVVLFVFIGNVAIKPLVNPLVNRFGLRRLLIASSVLFALTMAGCAALSATTPLVVIAALVFVSGVARSVGLGSVAILTLSEIPNSMMRHANTLASALTQTAMGLGVAVAAVGLRIGTLLSGTPSDAFRVDFALLALLVLAALLNILRLHRTAGDAVREPARV